MLKAFACCAVDLCNTLACQARKKYLIECQKCLYMHSPQKANWIIWMIPWFQYHHGVQTCGSNNNYLFDKSEVIIWLKKEKKKYNQRPEKHSFLSAFLCKMLFNNCLNVHIRQTGKSGKLSYICRTSKQQHLNIFIFPSFNSWACVRWEKEFDTVPVL